MTGNSDAKRPFATEYLRTYSREHLWYEVWMFFETAFLLNGFKLQSNNAALAIIIQNAVVEAFAIHCRNLLDFFYPNRKRGLCSTDVVIDDYLAPGTGLAKFPNQPDLLVEAEHRAHKQVSHLTSGRLAAGPGRHWNSSSIAAEMSKLVKEFLRLADTSKLDAEFVPLARRYVSA